jgi:hypothetical protein
MSGSPGSASVRSASLVAPTTVSGALSVRITGVDQSNQTRSFSVAAEPLALYPTSVGAMVSGSQDSVDWDLAYTTPSSAYTNVPFSIQAQYNETDFGTYRIAQIGAIAFDTSALDAGLIVTSATITLTTQVADITTAYLRIGAWGPTLTTADWQTPEQMAALPLAATFTGLTVGQNTATATNDLVAALNARGTVYCFLSFPEFESRSFSDGQTTVTTTVESPQNRPAEQHLWPTIIPTTYSLDSIGASIADAVTASDSVARSSTQSRGIGFGGTGYASLPPFNPSDTITLGSGNRLFNGGFETGLSPWVVNSLYASYALENTIVNSGAQSIKITNTASGQRQVLSSELFAVQPNTTYTITANLRASVAGAYRLSYEFFSSTGTSLASGTTSNTSISDTAFTAVTTTVTSGATAAFMQVGFRTPTTAAVGDVTYVDDFSVTGPASLERITRGQSREISDSLTASDSLSRSQTLNGSAVDALRVADTRVNLSPNPSFEVSSSPWTNPTSGATLTRITSDSYSGTACLEVTKGAFVDQGAVIVSTSALPAARGNTYTASIYVKVPSGNEDCGLRAQIRWQAPGTTIGYANGPTTTVTSAMGWTRLSITNVAPAGTLRASVQVTQALAGTSGQKYLVDAALLELGSSLGSYFDGGTTDGIWLGTADLSASILGSGIASSVGRQGPIADSLTASDTITGTYTPAAGNDRAASDSLSVSDATTLSVARAREASDLVTAGDQVTAAASRTRTAADSITAADTAAPSAALSRAAADTATAADQLSAAPTRTRAVTDSVTTSDALATSLGRARQAADTVTVADTAAPSVTRAIPAADTLTASDSVAAVVARSRAAADSVTVSDALTKAIGRSRPTVDSVTAADAAAYVLEQARQIVDSVTLTTIAEILSTAGQMAPGAVSGALMAAGTAPTASMSATAAPAASITASTAPGSTMTRSTAPTSTMTGA